MIALTSEPSSTNPHPQRPYSFILFLTLLLGVLIACITILAIVPPVSRDALTHHLFVPKLYIEHGSIYEIPNILFSYYPMNLDLLYMIPLYFGNDIIPKYIHLLFAVLTGWLIYGYLKNRISKVYGLLGTLFFLSIPIVVKLSTTVYVDLGLMFFTTASLLLLFRWLNSAPKLRYLFFAGICCGVAAGVKYNGLITLFLLPLFIPVLYIRSNKNSSKKSSKGLVFSLFFLLTALIAFSPWLIRNYTWTGNPVYPLHNSFFQQISTNQTVEQEETDQTNASTILKESTRNSTNVFVTRKILYHETWWQTLLLPIRFFFEGKDDNPQYFDGKLNPFLLLLPFFAFTRKSPTAHLQLEKATLLIFSILFFFFAFFQGALRIRYIVSIVPALALLSIFGLQNITLTISKFHFCNTKHGIRTLFFGVLGIMFSYNILYIVQLFHIVQPLPYLQGEVSKIQYISRFRPEYPVIQYANNHLQRDTKVLCIFLGNRGYYMNFIPIFEKPFQGGLLTDLLKSPQQNVDIRSQLLSRGPSHILLRNDLTQDWIQRLKKNKQEKVIQFLQDDTTRLVGNKNYTFLRIKQ